MNATIDPARRIAFQRLFCFGFKDMSTRCAARATQDADCIGEIADWLSILAADSAHDFARFREDWFWREHADLCCRFPARNIGPYRLYFELRRAEVGQR